MSQPKDLDFTEFMAFMADNDPGADLTLDTMLNTDRPRMVIILNKLDELGIRGVALGKLYFDCGMDIQEFFKRVEGLYAKTLADKKRQP